MHPIQRRLLELSQTHNLKELGLRKIGRLLGETHPQKVKHHMMKLGLLEQKKTVSHEAPARDGFFSIPLLGLANCGEATIIAESSPEGHLMVSRRLVRNFETPKTLFAVQAVGSSMNKADIDGSGIDNGDYVIVNSEDKNFKDGDYVLSLINGLANIKKFSRDAQNNRIVLVSESTQNYSPIFIHADDFAHYMTSGKVVAVLKPPRHQYGSTDIVFGDD